MTKPTVLSLFSGCGGLDLGFERAGFRTILAIDNWAPAIATYKANIELFGGCKVEQKSLALDDREIQLNELPKTDIIIGGPPCQGFSFAGKQRHQDPRNRLYWDFVRIVRHCKPKAFLMENVRGLEAMALENVINDFSDAGYRVSANVACATVFGAPQRRERLIVVGIRKGLRRTFSPPEELAGPLFGASEKVSILDAIGDLPEPRSVEDDDWIHDDDMSEHLRNHVYKPLTPTVQKFVRHIPNGGYFGDAPNDYLPERLKKILADPKRYRSPRLFPKPDPLKSAQTVPADTNPSLGGVLAPDFVYPNDHALPVEVESFTIHGVYSSPNPSRRITAREAARLQTFPDEFKFDGALTSQFRQIGNAVPVVMAEAFARRLKDHLRD